MNKYFCQLLHFYPVLCVLLVCVIELLQMYHLYFVGELYCFLTRALMNINLDNLNFQNFRVDGKRTTPKMLSRMGNIL